MIFGLAGKVVVTGSVFDEHIRAVEIVSEELPAHAMTGASRK
jgi:hypothetical protein